jgi:hypothetical protein
MLIVEPMKYTTKVDKIEEKVERINTKDDTKFKYIQKQFNIVKGEITTFKGGLRKELKAFKSDVYHRFDETKAFARNRLYSRLSSTIYKIYALVRKEDGQSRHEVHPDFPVTVRDFWALREKCKVARAEQFLRC